MIFSISYTKDNYFFFTKDNKGTYSFTKDNKDTFSFIKDNKNTISFTTDSYYLFYQG